MASTRPGLSVNDDARHIQHSMSRVCFATVSALVSATAKVIMFGVDHGKESFLD